MMMMIIIIIIITFSRVRIDDKFKTKITSEAPKKTTIIIIQYTNNNTNNVAILLDKIVTKQIYFPIIRTVHSKGKTENANNGLQYYQNGQSQILSTKLSP